MNEREIAFRLLGRIAQGAYANLILGQTLAAEKKRLTAVERRFITELVYGTVKYQACLDWVISQFVQKEGKLAVGPRILLRLSFYQLLFLDKIPPFAVTNEAVQLAKKYYHPGVASLVNGVLRQYLRQREGLKWPDEQADPLTYLAVVHSHPRWMLQRWLKRYGLAQTKKMCEFNNAPAELWLRTNTLRCTRAELLARLSAEGCLVQPSKRVPEGILLKEGPPLTALPSFQAGLFQVQDESSMLAAHVLQPQPGQTVLDVCAGPGGKTTHLAQLMQNKGQIIAVDLHAARLKLIRENAARLGIDYIQTKLLDARKIGTELDGLYELILVDAPCSGLGVLRRRPDARWRKKETEIETLAALQGEILAAVYPLLAPGGRLVYSTCTVEPEENTAVVAQFKANHPQMVSFDLTPFFPYSPVSEAEKAAWQKGERQFLPFSDAMEGFFLAGLRKEP